MSLATFLLGTKSSGKKNAIDSELDSLFHSKTPARCLKSARNQPVSERKKQRGSDVHNDELHRKRSRLSVPDMASSDSPPAKRKKSSKDRVRSGPESPPEPWASDARKAESSKNLALDESSLEISDENDDHPSTLVHETLQIQKDKPDKVASKKTKFTPQDETKERRDARTIFVGNLVPDVVLKRPLQKQLRQHLLALLPTAKIESTRFRSVAFQTPTSKCLEAGDDAKEKKQSRQHERDRASSWRDANAPDESKMDEKKFLTPNQKKKIAFINKDIHSEADSVHAYVVFAYPPPPHTRPANLPPLPPVMDPFEAARVAVERCNGTLFLDRMLRVDAVVKRSTVDSTSDSTPLSSVIGDPKLTIFVGNLDFASKEEDLRIFFERIVSVERGLPAAEGPQDEDKPRHWVTRVRMIRDRDSQLGKGFAYVQFLDRTCVDEILALQPGKLKFAKRKLRVQRCKSMPSVASGKSDCSSKPVQTPTRPVVPPIPQGDPSLGEKLVKLTKEERKRVKAADAERVARRMAKKKARVALVRQGVPLQTKQRERVRKVSAAKKLSGGQPKKTSKQRVRSEKSMAKKNIKK